MPPSSGSFRRDLLRNFFSLNPMPGNFNSHQAHWRYCTWERHYCLVLPTYISYNVRLVVKNGKEEEKPHYWFSLASVEYFDQDYFLAIQVTSFTMLFE